MIRAAKINVYARLMESQGISTKQLLDRTGIDPRLLSDSEGSVTRDMYYAVIMNMIRLSRNPGIAFSLGKVIEVGDFGIFGYAMLSCSTLGQQVRIRQLYHNPMFGVMVNFSNAKSGNWGFEVTISSSSLTETLRRFEIEECLVEGMTLVKNMTGIDPVIRKLELSYPEPSYVDNYKSFFKCPLEFNASQTVLSVKSPTFDTPLLGGNAELHAVCARHCQEVLQIKQPNNPLQSQLREMFLASPGHLPDLNSVCQMLGMSERNLRRKLELDGLSFQSLKDAFRFDLSRQLLVSARMAPKEVAFLLGYATPSAFSRAFKAWSGQTIQQYLQSL